IDRSCEHLLLRFFILQFARKKQTAIFDSNGSVGVQRHRLARRVH
uniref:Uncharacterized protein n=1 Tax=Aegilops tauschii subsp. strangulata TaxID=200361 RepID=A0A453HNZ4_AEGTS